MTEKQTCIIFSVKLIKLSFNYYSVIYRSQNFTKRTTLQPYKLARTKDAI